MGKENNQKKLFDLPEWWEEYWQDMPEFKQEDLTAFKSIIVHFNSEDDIRNFSELIKQKITTSTQSIWYPRAEIETYIDKRYTNES